MDDPPIEDADLDRATDREYAAVSVLAVLGVALAALGVLAFLAPPLVAVPALAAVLGLAALRRIRRSRGVLTGTRLAATGLALGAGLTLAAGGYHAWDWYAEYRTLTSLQDRTREIMDRIVAREWAEAFAQVPPGSPQHKGGLDLFRRRLTGLFAGAGDPVGRELRALQFLRTERDEPVAMAEVRLRLEQRTLDFHVWFQPDAEGRWRFVGIGGRETFESASRRGGPAAPPLPGPFARR
ncbi:MAG: hypothetical protein R6X20_02645 [Phycisphaerae bacterium]